jgi:hypothetical protein
MSDDIGPVATLASAGRGGPAAVQTSAGGALKVVWSSSDAADRERQIAAFCDWLPLSLLSLPGIDWTQLPGGVMGYLVNQVPLGVWWAHPTVVAAGAASIQGTNANNQYGRIHVLSSQMKAFHEVGARSLNDLGDRAIWQTFLHQQPGYSMLNRLRTYYCYANFVESVLDDLEEDERA